MDTATERRTKQKIQSKIRANEADKFDLSFNTITIIVGTDIERTFSIDERLLTNFSDFFATMLARPWRETQTRIVELPEDDPDLFNIFALFIHSGRINSVREGDVEIYPDGSRRDWEWARLGKAWVLGDKLQSTAFKDAIADAICDKITLDRRWPTTLQQIIYPGTTAAAGKIRSLCIDIARAKWSVGTMQTVTRDDAWTDFFADLSFALFQDAAGVGRREAKFEDPGCRYHEHFRYGKNCWKEMRFLCDRKEKAED